MGTGRRYPQTGSRPSWKALILYMKKGYKFSSLNVYWVTKEVFTATSFTYPSQG